MGGEKKGDTIERNTVGLLRKKKVMETEGVCRSESKN